MITADKQWTLLTIRSKFAEILNENSTNHCKLEDMLPVLEQWKDQLRRDAKKELLEEISQNYWWSNEDNTDEGIHLTFEELKQLKKNTLEDN